MRPPLPRLHAITDERIARRPDFAAVAADLKQGAEYGVAIHARGRALTGLEHFDLARRLAEACPPVQIFVNDRLDVALSIKASGVQLRNGSLPVSAARQLDATWWIGKSVHDLAEAEAARAEGADYLLVGPVYATATHPDRPPLGLETLARIVQIGLPVVAIGGIGAAEARAVKAAGAYGVAAIRALWDAADPAAAVRRMLKELQ